MSTLDRRSPTRAVLTVIAIPLVLAAALMAVTAARAATQTATIQNFAFSPATLNVSAGDSVTWTNKDSTAHTVTSDTGVFDQPAAAGASVTVSFPNAGTFAYHCTIHPNMKGTVIVAAASAGGATTSTPAAGSTATPAGGTTSTPARAPATGSGIAPGNNYAPVMVLLGGLLLALAIGGGLVAAQSKRH